MLLSATELLKKSYNLYKENLKLFLTYTILMIIPPVIVVLLAVIITRIFKLDPNQITGKTIVFTFIFFVLSITSYIITFLFFMTFLKIIANRYEGKTVQDPKTEIMSVKPLILTGIITSILFFLVVLGGSILFLIPGIIFTVWFSFSLYAVVLDGQKDTDALRFSKKLVTGRWWRVAWRLFLIGLIYFVISNILFPLSLATKASGSQILITTISILTTIVTIFLAPFITSAKTILYIELKNTPLEKDKTVPPSALSEPPVS